MQTTNKNQQLSGFVRLPQVLSLFPVSPAHWWRGVKNGEYPKPVKLSARITAWKVEDIQKLIRDAGEQ